MNASSFAENSSATTIRRAARHVLGDSPTARALIDLCDDHEQAIGWIMDDRAPDATTVSVVGATGQGKTWLVRQLVQDPHVRQSLRSGDRLEQTTRQMVWIGPQPPTGLDSQYETYLHTAEDGLCDLGGRYLLADSPGATDLSPQVALASERAVAMSSVLILVVRRAQLRSEIASQIASAGDGTLVVPVITTVREAPDDPELRSDLDALLARLRSVAPRTEMLAPIIVPDFELSDENEATIATRTTTQLANQLRPHLAGGDIAGRRRSARLQAAEDRFRQQIERELSHQSPRLAEALEHLDSAVERLPHDVAIELIGSGETLRAGIRSRLRAQLMINTAAIWFPYRTILGLLNLTHGAWDRLILALAGSLPSLVGSAWAGVANLRNAQQDTPTHDRIRERSSAMIADRITPLLMRFHSELQRLNSSPSTPPGTTTQTPAQLLGIDSLREHTQQIFDEEVARAAPPRSAGNLCGLIGVVLFWGLLAGPVIALYHDYFGASYQTIVTQAHDLEAFPKPEFGMVFTSLILSLLPMSLFAMLVISWVQRRTRQQHAAHTIESRIQGVIEQLQQQNVLRVEFHDALVDDARCLLRAGRGNTTP